MPTIYLKMCHFVKRTLPILSRPPSSVTFPPKADNAESKRSNVLPCRSILREERLNMTVMFNFQRAHLQFPRPGSKWRIFRWQGGFMSAAVTPGRGGTWNLAEGPASEAGVEKSWPQWTSWQELPGNVIWGHKLHSNDHLTWKTNTCWKNHQHNMRKVQTIVVKLSHKLYRIWLNAMQCNAMQCNAMHWMQCLFWLKKREPKLLLLLLALCFIPQPAQRSILSHPSHLDGSVDPWKVYKHRKVLHTSPCPETIHQTDKDGQFKFPVL